jgi:hypothetical protein
MTDEIIVQSSADEWLGTVRIGLTWLSMAWG